MDNIDAVMFLYMYGLILAAGVPACAFVYVYGRLEK
jgi:hypothetical protein